MPRGVDEGARALHRHARTELEAKPVAHRPIALVLTFALVAGVLLGIMVPPTARAPVNNGRVVAAFGPNIIQNSLLTGGPGIYILCYIDWYTACSNGNPRDMMWFGTYDYLGITATGTGSLDYWKLPDIPPNGTTMEPGPGKWENSHTQTMLHSGFLTQIDPQNERVTFTGSRANGASYTVTMDYYALPSERTIRVLVNVTNNAALAYDFAYYHSEDVDTADWPGSNIDVNGDANDAADDTPPFDAPNGADNGAGDPGDTWDERILPYTGSSWWTNWQTSGIWTSGWQNSGVGYITVLDASGQDNFDQTVIPAVPGSDGRPDDYSGLFSFESGIDWYVGRWDAAAYGPGVYVADPQSIQNGCYVFPPPTPIPQYYSWEDTFECNDLYWDGVGNNLLDNDNGVGLLKDLGSIGPGATKSATFYIGEPPDKADLVVANSDITVQPDQGSTYVGTPNWINVTVHNGGGLEITSDFSVGVYRSDPDLNADGIVDGGVTLIASGIVTASPGNPMTPGETRVVSFPWSPTAAEIGQFTLHAVVDYQGSLPFADGTVDELDNAFYEITNNKAYYDTASVPPGPAPPDRTATAPDYEVHPPAKPNIVMTNADLTVWPDFGSTFSGTPLLLNATVRNTGGTSILSDFPVGFYKDDPDGDADGVIDPAAVLIGSVTVPAGAGIGAGESRIASLSWTPALLDIGQFTVYSAADFQPSLPFLDGQVDELDQTANEVTDNKAFYDTGLYAPGTVPPFVTASAPDYEVHAPPLPSPPRELRTAVSGPDLVLTWLPPLSGLADFYLIYRGQAPRGIDLTTPYAQTVGPVTTFTDVGVVPSGELYYVARAFNTTLGEAGSTSNSAGAFPIAFQPGLNAFSLPLAPFVPLDVAALHASLGSIDLQYMDSTGYWRTFPADPSVPVDVGQGYLANFAAATSHTFVGFPGSMISYGPSFGFTAAEAQSLQASVTPSGDVALTWAQSTFLGGYCVFRMPTRDGFHDGTAVMLGCTITPTDPMWTDPGAALAAGEWYYIVTPPVVNPFGPGSTTYSVGVWTANYTGAHSLGLPLRPNTVESVDWYTAGIPSTLGMSWMSGGRWQPHFQEMPAGVYDVALLQGQGFQFQVRTADRYVFVGT